MKVLHIWTENTVTMSQLRTSSITTTV